MKKLTVLALVGLLLMAVLIFIGCGEPCIGSGNCTVTIKQDAYGLSVDYDKPQSTCGLKGSFVYANGEPIYSGGCEVENNINNRKRTFGTHSCSCDSDSTFIN